VQCTVPIKRQITAHLKVLGANVRRERVAAGLTQERLAELAELNIRTLQSIEAGELNVLVTTTMRLRLALKCSWESLMVGC
jgi:transcriptional regulator with XRE-family HTH domain